MKAVDIINKVPRSTEYDTGWVAPPVGFGAKAIEVKQYAEKCNAWEPMENCNNPDCSWFNHSMVGMKGGDLPEGFKEP